MSQCLSSSTQPLYQEMQRLAAQPRSDIFGDGNLSPDSDDMFQDGSPEPDSSSPGIDGDEDGPVDDFGYATASSGASSNDDAASNDDTDDGYGPA